MIITVEGIIYLSLWRTVFSYPDSISSSGQSMLNKLAITLLITLASLGCKPASQVKQATNGVIDLAGYDPGTGELIKLEGEWCMYWDQFYLPGDSAINPMFLINVPRRWNDYLWAGGKLPKYGKATYQLTLKLNPAWVDQPGKAAMMGLKIRDIHSAYRVFINGRHYLDKGNLNEGPQYKSVLGHETIYFEADTSMVVITIHVANYSDPRQAGMDESIILGSSRSIKRNMLNSNFLYTLSFGILFILFFYHLMLYLFRQKDRFNLDFALVCLLLSIQSLFMGQKAIYNLFPNLDADLYIRMLMSSLLVIAFAFRYYGKLLPREFPARLVKTVTWFYGIMTLYFLFQTFNINSIGVAYLLITILMLVYAFIAQLISVIKKRPFATVIFIGTSFAILAGINDSLHALEIIYTGYYAPLGFIAYTFSQSLLISFKFSQSFKRTEKLSKQLESLNQNLEEIVENRTRDLDNANQDLTRLNATKDHFFSIIAHDLKGPIGAVTSLLEVIINDDADITEEHRKLLMKQIYNSTENTYNLLENLLTWARSQQGEIAFEPAAYRINEIARKVEDLLTESARKKGITLSREIDADYLIYCDQNMIETVLRNLVSNSIKFTGSGGKVTIRTSPDDDGQVLVSVTDTGIGMSESLLNSLFNIDKKGPGMKGTEGETGTGLGLIISDDFLGKHGSKLVVTSEINKGSTFSFTLAQIAE